MGGSLSSGTPLVVAIDGPSGSGKSSVSRAVATALDAAYLDTGAMYRALTWWCLAAIATNLEVRADMRRRQRALIADGLAAKGAVVAEGRDITTVVAPDAPVRILLTASEDARLARRAQQDLGSADAGAKAATRDRVVARDAADSTVSQFTTAADGVVTIDSSELDFGQTVAAVLAVVADACNRDRG
jgi:cytidylate kinase